MKSFRQLLRQRIKYIAGLILMTVAAAILCVCVGQALAAKNTADVLDRRFTTVALPIGTIAVNKDFLITSDISLADGLLQWLHETAATDSKIIKDIAEHGIISAYIPELTPVNYTQSNYIPAFYSVGNSSNDDNSLYYMYQPDPDGMPYSCAMLVITLEEVGEPYEHKARIAERFFHDLRTDCC